MAQDAVKCFVQFIHSVLLGFHNEEKSYIYYTLFYILLANYICLSFVSGVANDK